MTINFQEWAHGSEQRFQIVEQQLSRLCSLTRNVRVAASKIKGVISSENAKDPASELAVVLDHLAKHLDSEALSHHFPLLIRKGSDRKETEILQLSTQRLDILNSLTTVLNNGPSEDLAPPPVKLTRSPPKAAFIQRGGRQLSALAGAFQLQDCFEQRSEHIATAIFQTRNAPEEHSPLMHQVLNCQILGLAKMISDFTNHAEVSAASLKDILHQESTDLDSQSLSCAEFGNDISQYVLDPLREYIVNLKRFLITCFDGDSDNLTIERDEPQADRGASVTRTIHAIEYCLNKLQPHQPPASHPTIDAVSTLADLLNDTEDAISDLKTASSDLARHAENLPAVEDYSAATGRPDTLDILKSVLATFTMDAERSDYYSALHKLGIER